MPTVPTQVTLAQLPAYQYVTPPVPDTIAKGRESAILYNGLVLNDRRRPDRYYVTEVDGLGGPDIRDNRENRPQAHGEIPYDAYWGGNTMTIEGTIQAGNFMEGKRMERDFEAAYWQELSGIATFPGDGTMRFGSNGTVAYHSLRQYIDHIVTAEIFVPLFYSTQQVGVMAKCQASNQYVSWLMGANTLTLQAGVTGSGLAVGSGYTVSFTPTPGVSYWMQLVMVGDTMQGLCFDQNPFTTTATPVASTILYTLPGVIAQSYGFMQQGYAGIIASGSSQMANAAAFDFRVDALWPSDFVQNVRPISTPTVKAVQQTDGSKYKADFQVSVRASNPRWTSPQLQYVSGLIGGTTPQQTLVVVNRGNWLAQPIIYVGAYGGSTAKPTITNLTTGTFVLLDATVSASYGITMNTANETLFDTTGANVFDFYDPTSTGFIQLVPGQNRFTVTSNNSPQYCYIIVYWYNTWK
jgi:hypothetical protein